VFLCYDLPVETTKQKSDYRHFTKFIKSIGFIMIQNSIGIKYIRNHDSFRKEVAALRTKCPKEGEIYLWNISFNKYRSVVVLQGRGVPIEELRETIVIL